MKKLTFFLLLNLLIAFSILAKAQDGDDDDDDAPRPAKSSAVGLAHGPAGSHFACPYEKDFTKSQKIGAYTLRLLPLTKKAEAKEQGDNFRCRAVLTSSGGKNITIAEDWALSVDTISGRDLNADGTPDIILDGYSGGTQCCYTYAFVSLGPTPQLIRELHNQFPLTFERQGDGSTRIDAKEGVFDYFLLPHQQAVIPQLILQMEGGNLLDVSPRFAEIYDKQIEDARSQLIPAELEKFRKSNYGDRLFMDQVSIVRPVLTIVLNYLYSGREEKAWQALNELWPASDVERVKSLILERRARGLVAQALKDAPKPIEQAASAP